MTTIQKQQKALKDKVALHTKEQYDADLSILAERQEAMQNLASMKGFKYIKDFWMKQEMTAMQEFEKVNPDEKYEVCKIQSKFHMAKEFNMFLSN